MIQIKASRAERGQYISNIIDVYASATDDQWSHGVNWYRHAHEVATMLADGDVRTGAGLLAALSPQTSWWLNVELASDAFESGSPSRHVGDALSKAAKILAGIDPSEVLPMGRKTGHFYRSILDPSDPVAVCIDRHAHDVAVGVPYGDEPRGLSAKGRYSLLAHCYWEASQRLDMLPSTVQAVTWVVWRDRLAGMSTRGTRFNREV
jgi:hypothetical protein